MAQTIQEINKDSSGFFRLKFEIENPETQQKEIVESPSRFYKIQIHPQNIVFPMFSFPDPVTPGTVYMAENTNPLVPGQGFDDFIKGTYFYETYLKAHPGRRNDELFDESGAPQLPLPEGLTLNSKPHAGWCLNVEPCSDLFRPYCCPSAISSSSAISTFFQNMDFKTILLIIGAISLIIIIFVMFSSSSTSSYQTTSPYSYRTRYSSVSTPIRRRYY